MGTGIGQTLDKYELLEKVGQGGMAVVYRGLDTTLRREVAVKVLHRHLADSSEARDRFEREAQAVAKLRHENILEIFDFSGNDSEESYIVTEFIDGQTLKQFITEHEIKYPEVGAMITVEVCRALGHAHSFGVLHRDVKPENVMIRNDGVIKLTDFGIAQMLDHHRLTVTGQLLGSPAYMAPEHVEGGKLDFRTDVFAAGVVLYQLCCGELPFRGKNPHEILKRIAETSYTDPCKVNPLVGSELGAIIRKCLAHDKEDRYRDVSEMQRALEQFLAGSGLVSIREELGRFFAAPVSYEMALRSRLIAFLAARGREKLKDDRNAALELFNRVLTLDPQNREVLEEIEKLSRQRKWMNTAVLVGSLLLLGAGALAARKLILDRRDGGGGTPLATAGGALHDAGAVAPIPVFDAAPSPAIAADAAPIRTAPRADAAPKKTPTGNGGGKKPEKQDAGPPIAEPAKRTFTLRVTPANQPARYRVDGGDWQPVEGEAIIQVPAVDTVVQVESAKCCKPATRIIKAGEVSDSISVVLARKAAMVTPVCKLAGAAATIGGKYNDLGHPRTVEVDQLSGSKKVEVEFTLPDGKYNKQTVMVEAGDTKDVTCGDFK
ncbi:MAG TPA: serine/threonine-protein kinase [Kofleriaceae bacterium]|nr:serine/threonine-protein kinase [Kofleriaceae bacterium]